MTSFRSSCFVDGIKRILESSTEPTKLADVKLKSGMTGNTWINHYNFTKSKKLVHIIKLGKYRQNGIMLLVSDSGRKYLELLA